MTRYAIVIEYDGTPFVGWQVQDNGPSIQEALAAAIHSLSGQQAKVYGAGRTDTGVHALGQVAHFDLDAVWAVDKLRDAINFHLKPLPVAVVRAIKPGNDFHARFSATRRHYQYRIINRRPPLVLEKHRAWHVPRSLDEKAMNKAALELVGTHDFSTFRASQCQANSPVKSVDHVAVKRDGEAVTLKIAARSFLHNQVRSIAGSLKCVGEGRWSTQKFKKALASCDRKACGPVAPPWGLYLEKVEYDESWQG